MLFQTPSANCMTADDDYLYVGCSGGVVRVFSAKTLHFVSSMPKPHYLGVDVAAGLDSRYFKTHLDFNSSFSTSWAAINSDSF